MRRSGPASPPVFVETPVACTALRPEEATTASCFCSWSESFARNTPACVSSVAGSLGSTNTVIEASGRLSVGEQSRGRAGSLFPISKIPIPQPGSGANEMPAHSMRTREPFVTSNRGSARSEWKYRRAASPRMIRATTVKTTRAFRSKDIHSSGCGENAARDFFRGVEVQVMAGAGNRLQIELQHGKAGAQFRLGRQDALLGAEHQQLLLHLRRELPQHFFRHRQGRVRAQERIPFPRQPAVNRAYVA